MTPHLPSSDCRSIQRAISPAEWLSARTYPFYHAGHRKARNCGTARAANRIVDLLDRNHLWIATAYHGASDRHSETASAIAIVNET